MNNQEVFTKIKDHLLTQMKQSNNGSMSSRYRGANDLKCAIGAVIPDTLYSIDMEGWSISRLIYHHTAIAELFKGVDQTLLKKLQGLHDFVEPSNWKAELISVANEFNLEF